MNLEPCQLLLCIFCILLIVDGIINNCPINQVYDTHLICKIFANTNINEIFSSYDFSENNYCDWNDPDIDCSNDNTITRLRFYQIGLNGTLNLTNSWPSNLIKINLAQHEEDKYEYDITLKAEWKWKSVASSSDIELIVIDYNEVIMFIVPNYLIETI